MSRKQTCLGRSLIKSHSRKKFVAKEGHRHSTDLPDGRDHGRPNLCSVTENTSLEDFMERVQLAHKEYDAEFQNITIVSKDAVNKILSDGEKLHIFDAQEKHKKLLRIPRRPVWDQNTTKEQLDHNENESFLNWRRNLASLEQEEHINLTPYEKNLEVWRQLWRVIERSDVVVQIIDSRNPLLFRCEDLETYVKEVDEKKINVLLLNKADFLTFKQRQQWADYFASIGVKIVFFSALQQMQKTDEVPEQQHLEHESEENQDFEQEEHSVENESCDTTVCNNPNLLSREELIMFLKTLGKQDPTNKVKTVGLVGYPNVGKSSTINAVFFNKKVSVSATPGKTKHFQTLMVDPEFCFCDCPGLVFPNFVSTKAEMVVNGILPIDHLTSHIPPITLVANLIPREMLESTYSIILPAPSEGQDPSRPPTAEELLERYGYMRGFMTKRGLPDTARSSRYILKDYVNGRLLYCHAPPSVKQEQYQDFSLMKGTKIKAFGDLAVHNTEGQYKKETFGVENRNLSSTAHVKNQNHATRMISQDKLLTNSKQGSPKSFKKHHNKNRKEKLRRVYADLDNLKLKKAM